MTSHRFDVKRLIKPNELHYFSNRNPEMDSKSLSREGSASRFCRVRKPYDSESERTLSQVQNLMAKDV